MRSLMYRVRRRIGLVAGAVARWANGQASSMRDPNDPADTLTRNRPVRFRSVEEFAHFVAALPHVAPEERIVRGGGASLMASEVRVNEHRDTRSVADAVAAFSRAARLILHVQVASKSPSQGEVNAYTVTFAPGSTTVSGTPASAERCKEVASLVDQYTTPTRQRERRRQVPVLNPVTAQELLQNDRDDEVALKSACVGGVYGAIAGGVLGAVAGAILQGLSSGT